MTQPHGPQLGLAGPTGGGGDIDWGKVQEAQRQALIAGQEAMEQSTRGLMEVREAIQRRAQLQ